MAYFKHEKAIVETGAVGDGTRVWAFAHILPGAVIGRDCNICDHTFIENDVVIGDRVTVKCGVFLWDGTTVEDDVFIGPNATFTNDPFPRSKHYPARFARTVVRRGASIGANATLLPGLEIGPGAMVGAGAVVTASVPANAVVVGNPARITGYAGVRSRLTPGTAGGTGESPPIGVPGVELLALRNITDLRGDLTVAELEKDLPFKPRRVFFVHHVPSRKIRGEHAHRTCHQVLFCLNGSVSLVVDDGSSRAEVVLDSTRWALHVPPMVWCIQYRFSPDAVLGVFASHPYDPDDYIRDYETYLELKARDRGSTP